MGCRAAAAAALVALVAPAAALAQPPASRPAPARVSIRAAASEQLLWLAEVEADRSQLFFRTPGSGFDLGRVVQGRIAGLFPIDAATFVVMANNTIYRYGDDMSSPAGTLPNRDRPIGLAGGGEVIYALGSAPPASTAPIGGELRLYRLDAGQWTEVCAAPAGLVEGRTTRAAPRLLYHRDQLSLLGTCEGEPGRVVEFVLDAGGRSWRRSTQVAVERLVGLWAFAAGRVPTLVTASSDGDAETFSVRRRLGDGPGAEWQVTPVELSPLPGDATPHEYRAAMGFNQCIGLLVVDSQERGFIQFAGVGRPPIEPTISTLDVFVKPAIKMRLQGLVQVATLVILTLLLVGFVAFRRSSMLKPATLPQGYELALLLQRIAAGGIDVLLFAVPATWMLDVPWRDALWSLGQWGTGGGATPDLPPRDTLLWWGLIAGGYSLYALIIESITGRTIGKVLLGVRVLTETGQRPAAWQVAVRNLFRLIELAPQFWLLAILLVISRNHQRLGDIFAQTVAVRRAPTPTGPRRRDGAGDAQDRDSAGPE